MIPSLEAAKIAISKFFTWKYPISGISSLKIFDSPKASEKFKREIYGYDGAIVSFKGFHPSSFTGTLYCYLKVKNKQIITTLISFDIKDWPIVLRWLNLSCIVIKYI